MTAKMNTDNPQPLPKKWYTASENMKEETKLKILENGQEKRWQQATCFETG